MQDERPAARYWIFSILLIQIVICCILLIIWGIRLVKKGSSLVEKDSTNCNNEKVYVTSRAETDNQLFKVIKVFKSIS